MKDEREHELLELPDEPLPSGLAERILADAARELPHLASSPPDNVVRLPPRQRWAARVWLAAAASFGLWVGLGEGELMPPGSATTAERADEAEIVAAAFAPPLELDFEVYAP